MLSTNCNTFKVQSFRTGISILSFFKKREVAVRSVEQLYSLSISQEPAHPTSQQASKHCPELYRPEASINVWVIRYWPVGICTHANTVESIVLFVVSKAFAHSGNKIVCVYIT